MDASRSGDFGERFRESEQRLQDILDNAPAVVYVKDLEGRHLLINRRYGKLYHLSRAETVGKTDHDIFPKEVADGVRANDELVLGTGRPLEVEESIFTDEGDTRTYLSLKFPLRNAGGTTYAVCGISTDVTARKRAEEALLDVREAERVRMAHDLHDGALQDLAYGMAEVHVAKTQLPDDPGSAAAALARGSEALRRATESLRAAVYDLRLGDEKNRPFPRLVESLVERMRVMDPGVAIRLEVQEGFPSGTAVGPAVGADTAVLRVIGEALTNARRHSGAHEVRVSLRAEGGYLVAEVADDGRGFGPEAELGVGLGSMRERALRLEGTLAVESEPGEGTRVRLRVPMGEALPDAPQEAR